MGRSFLLRRPLVKRASSTSNMHCPMVDAPTQGYLFRDQFTSADGGIADDAVRTCVPGPGSITFEGNRFSIASNKLSWTAGAGGFGNHYCVGSAVTRAAGRMMLGKLTRTGTAGFVHWGFSVTATPSANTSEHSFLTTNAPALAIREETSTCATLAALADGTEYDVAIVLNDATTRGAWYFIRGGIYTHWTLLFISDENDNATLYPFVNNFSQAGKLDDWRVPTRLWLPQPNAQTSDSTTMSQTYVDLPAGIADFIADVNVTRGNGDGGTDNGLEFYFRVSAGLSGLVNRWILRLLDDGSVVLRKEEDGESAVDTTIFAANTIAKNQTWTIRLIAEGQNLNLFSHRTSGVPTQTWTAYGSNPFTTGTSFNETEPRMFVSPLGDIGGANNLVPNYVKVYRRIWSDGFPSMV